MDAENNCNILHYASPKSKPVTCRLFAAELYALVSRHNSCIVVYHALSIMLGRLVKIKIYTDLLFLFDLLTTLNTTTKKRHFTDLSVLQESYERRQLTDIVWIHGNSNPADVLKKENGSSALKALMETIKLST